MMDNRIHKAALAAAAKSPCKKRKVGAIIAETCSGFIISEGWNHNYTGLVSCAPQSCEDSEGNTLPSVVHAEVDAIQNLPFNCKPTKRSEYTMYVTHTPCKNCQQAIKDAGITEIEIVTEFMKFDTDKLRYDLVPPLTIEALAKVLTYGAKKYAPNNWRETKDLDRYVAALFRHIEAWRKGEKVDEESGLKHLEHALTNLCFLLELDTDDYGTNLSNVLGTLKSS